METEFAERRAHASLLSRFVIQLCSTTPEVFQLDLIVHTVVVLLLTVLYGYFSLRMDEDPEACWAPIDPRDTDIVDEQSA